MSNQNQIVIPDIGGATDVDVIEILVKPGDTIDKDTPLVTLESDKASMEIPSPSAGVVDQITLKLGDKVSAGDAILTLKGEAKTGKAENGPEPSPKKVSENQSVAEQASVTKEQTPEKSISAQLPESQSQSKPQVDNENNGEVFAGPGVRRLAFELGLNLAQVQGSGHKSRITKEDVQAFVKQRLNGANTGLSMPAAPFIDFSQFGEIEAKPLNKIKRLTGVNLHRAWITVPHVTQFDEADITTLEAFRKKEGERQHGSDYKLTILAFVCKVVGNALLKFPQFNTSLDQSGEHLIYKKFVNIGIAVETPNGLVVPVIKGVDHLSVVEIAKEMARLSAKAREKGLMPVDMNGGCFTISSLGGIGGTSFTPIVNFPEVAILGLSRSSIKPVYEEGEFKPRLFLPMSLSYDHRVIDGAEAARFTRYLAESLEDIRRILL